MNRLLGKRALITGGVSGIGAATVERFLDEGANVVVLDRDHEGLQRLKHELTGLTGIINADVSDYKAVIRAFTDLDDIFDGFDVLINNAGITMHHRFIEITPQEWQKTLNVNLNGVFYVAQQAARRMLDSGGGVILNMGSTNAIMGYQLTAAYNSSKAGVVELSRSMALELAPTIRVNTVCPGYILTPLLEKGWSPEIRNKFASKIPLRRLGRPEEIAGLFTYLASDEASYITGQTFVIDGGEIAGGLASQ